MTIHAPPQGVSPIVPTGISPGEIATSPVITILPTIPSGISGGSSALTPLVPSTSVSPNIYDMPQNNPRPEPSLSFIAATSQMPNAHGRNEATHSNQTNSGLAAQNLCVTMEEIDDPEASASSLSSEQRRLHRAEKQKHHDADIPPNEDDILAQNAILESIQTHECDGILEAALAYLMSPRHENESDEDFALRSNVLQRLRNVDQFNSPPNESANHISTTVQSNNTPVMSNLGHQGARSLSMLVESMQLSTKTRSEKSDQSHYAPSLFYEILLNSLTAISNQAKGSRSSGKNSNKTDKSALSNASTRTCDPASTAPTPTPTPATNAGPEVYAPAFAAEIGWQNRVALQRERFRLICTCDKSRSLDSDITIQFISSANSNVQVAIHSCASYVNIHLDETLCLLVNDEIPESLETVTAFDEWLLDIFKIDSETYTTE
ncbi:hypothetical protein C8J56DRAFT_1037929 [Mycena floridula]|nr:hypothetical protein C8J56DRAFT_1037929 [Mycena floridula]